MAVGARWRATLMSPAVLFAVVLCGVLPGSAQAVTTTLYAAPAGSGSLCTQGSPCSFATALSQANNFTGPGTIQLAAGTYTATSTSTDPNSGTGAWVITNAHNQPISIAGAGEGSTIINTSGTASTTAHTIVLDTTGENTGGATVSGLTVQIPDETGDDGVGSIGPSVTVTISNVAIDGAAGLTSSTGLREASATVDNVTISLPEVGPSCGGTCNEGWYQANGPASADGLTVTADEGINVNLDVGSFSDLRVFADVSGVALSSGASTPTSYPLTESEIVMSGANSQALSLDDNNGMGTIDATFDTLTDGSSSGTSGIVGLASKCCSLNSTSDFAISDSLVWGFATPLWCDQVSPATAALSATYSDFDPTGDVSTGCTPSSGTGDINANPNLVTQANGDETPAFNSPAIDAGDPTITGPLTDLAGNPRPVNTGAGSRVDMGAFQYQTSRAPRAVAANTAGTVLVGTPTVFDATGSSDPDSLALSYSWSFDDGGTASGVTVQHVFTTPGVHRGTVTVTNGLGMTSTATAQVTAVAATPTVASAGAASVSGSSARERVSCAGTKGATCTVRITLSVIEAVKGGKVVAVSAAAHVKTKKRTVTVGSASITFGAGQSAMVGVRLNSQGQRLLKSHPVLAVKLTASSGGRVLHTQVLRFKRPKQKAHSAR